MNFRTAWTTLIFVALACGASALTVSNSYGGASSSVTVNYNVSLNRIEWSRTHASGGGWTAGTWIYRTAGPGAGYGAVVYDGGPDHSTVTGNASASNGEWFLVGARCSSGGSWWLINPDQIQYFQAVGSSLPANATKNKSKLIEFKNTTNFKLRYDVKDGAGNVVESFYVKPGETYYRQFMRDSTDAGQWTVTPNVVGATVNGDGVLSYTGNNSDVVPMTASNFLTTGDFTAGSNPGMSATTVTAPTVAVNPTAKPPPPSPSSGPSENNQYRGSVVYSGTSGAAATDALRTADFKEGVDQIVGELKKVNEKSQADQDRHKAAEAAAETAKSSGLSGAQTKGATAQTEFNTNVPAVGGTVGSGATRSNSAFSLSIPDRTGHHRTVSLDPSTMPKIADILPWIRAVLAVLVSGWLSWWLYTELGQYIMFSSILQPAKGNTVAGSGGQITSAIVAAWMTLCLAGLPTAICALWTGAPLFSSVGASVDLFGGAPSGAAQAGVYLIYQMLPMATIATAITTMLVVKKAGMAIYFGVATAIRWCVA